MARLLVLLALLALAAAPAAAADGFGLFVQQGGEGALSPDGSLRYYAVGANDATVLQAVQTSDGLIRDSVVLPGQWGLPGLVPSGSARESLSHDGRTLVVASMPIGGNGGSDFLLYDAHRLRMTHSFRVPGVASFDAMSPDASKIYVIAYVDGRGDLSRYVVRAYDVAAGKLLPGRIADRTQRSWVMQGYPVSRATSPDGRWVYTLYQNPGGSPFVHALDTVGAAAHCVGIPWRGLDQNALFNVVLAVRGRSLDLRWRSGRPWLRVDRTTWRVSKASAGGFPWVWAALAGAALLLAGGGNVLRRRGVVPASSSKEERWSARSHSYSSSGRSLRRLPRGRAMPGRSRSREARVS